MCRQYTKKKGFAEDLSEGKISLPLIHTLAEKSQYRGRLLNILQRRKVGNSLSPELRKLALDDITAAGGLEYTKTVIMALQKRLDRSLAQSEESAGGSNWILRLMKKRLEL
jgi:geranylgeranyl pyrophosphate synthase